MRLLVRQTKLGFILGKFDMEPTGVLLLGGGALERGNVWNKRVVAYFDDEVISRRNEIVSLCLSWVPWPRISLRALKPHVQGSVLFSNFFIERDCRFSWKIWTHIYWTFKRITRSTMQGWNDSFHNTKCSTSRGRGKEWNRKTNFHFYIGSRRHAGRVLLQYGG